jgi:hopanoid biosynthesis associated RND transporter like protein HpnN
LAPIVRLVAANSRRAWLTTLVVAALCVLAAHYAAGHFAMTTDTAELISPELPWRQDLKAINAAFPQRADLIVAVVDGATPELTARAADDLAAELARRGDFFKSVQQPDGGPFFARNGLLFLSVDEVGEATRQLIAAQPFLGPLSADPSLRGVMESLSTALLGVQHGEAKLEQLDPAMRGLADALDRVARGVPAFFSWQTIVSGRPAGVRETRRILLVQPKLDNTQLVPAAAATEAIRATARELLLDPAHGVTVRLTGSVVLADEEFATLAQRADLIGAAMMLALVVMLWLAVRSIRISIAIMVTTLAGLLLTASLGLFLVGRFNLISVAFIPLFVGLGVDFAIQFAVRYRAERVIHRQLSAALATAGGSIGGTLALAAAAIGTGFFAFLPTAYIGAAELGLIAGMGMIIAFVLSITLFPALLAILRPGAEAREVGFVGLAGINRRLLRGRRVVLAVAGAAAVLCVALLPFLSFDFNPLHLRSTKMESVSTLLDLLADTDRTPNTVDVLAPSLAEADALAERLSRLPQVAHAVTLSSFIPEKQTEKLQLIEDAASLLGPTLSPPRVRPAPSDAETAESMAATARALGEAAGAETSPAAEDAKRLAAILDTLAKGTPELRARANETLIPPLQIMLAQLRSLLEAQKVTRQSLPADLVRDWVTGDGRAKVQVFPSGDSNDNRNLERFVAAVRELAPHATGAPISIQEAAHMIVGAFIEAGLLSFVAVAALLVLVLRRTRDVILTMIPILLGGLLTLGSCVVVGQPLNFANIIALPLLFGLGVAFNIYFVRAWRAGEARLLQSSLTRAVLFSALATGTAFGSLWLSPHPGTASMGRLLMISLAWTLVTTLLFQPALLGPPRGRHR